MDSQDEWQNAFSRYLSLYLRSELGLEAAKNIAVIEWLQHKDLPAVDAAARWAVRSPRKPGAE